MAAIAGSFRLPGAALLRLRRLAPAPSHGRSGDHLSYLPGAAHACAGSGAGESYSCGAAGGLAGAPASAGGPYGFVCSSSCLACASCCLVPSWLVDPVDLPRER